MIKSGNKTSSGEIGLDIRTHASPKVGQDQVSGGVSVLCLHAAPVAKFETSLVSFYSVNNLYRIKFQHGVKFQKKGKFLKCRGSLYNDSSKKHVTFQRWKVTPTCPNCWKVTLGHILTVEKWPGGHFSLGSIFNVTLVKWNFYLAAMKLCALLLEFRAMSLIVF